MLVFLITISVGLYLFNKKMNNVFVIDVNQFYKDMK